MTNEDYIHDKYYVKMEEETKDTNDLQESIESIESIEKLYQVDIEKISEKEPAEYWFKHGINESVEDFIARKELEEKEIKLMNDMFQDGDDFLSNEPDAYKDFQSPITKDFDFVERIDKTKDFLADPNSSDYIQDYGGGQNDGTNLKMNFEIPKMSKTPVTIAETKAKMKKLKAEIRDLKAIYPIIEESDSPERFDNILHAISSRKEELARLNEIVLGGDMDSKEEKKKETEDDPDEDDEDEESIKKKKSKNKDEDEDESEKVDEDLIGLHEIKGINYWVEENGDFFTVLIEQGTGDIYKKDFKGNINK